MATTDVVTAVVVVAVAVVIVTVEEVDGSEWQRTVANGGKSRATPLIFQQKKGQDCCSQITTFAGNFVDGWDQHRGNKFHGIKWLMGWS